MLWIRYGDKTPVTYVGRLFAVSWILSGVVIVSIVTSTIATSLTSYVVLGTDIPVYGSKVRTQKVLKKYIVTTMYY